MKYFKVKNSKGLSCDGETYVQFEPYGKAWKSLKSLERYFCCLYQQYNAKQKYLTASKDWVIVEYDCVEETDWRMDEVSRIPVTYFDRRQKKIDFINQYGKTVFDLYSSLEKEEKLEEYKWMLVVDYVKILSGMKEFASYYTGDFIKEISKIGIKKSEYKMKTLIEITEHPYRRYDDTRVVMALAFKEKDRAMLLKLALQYPTKFLDLVELKEVEDLK